MPMFFGVILGALMTIGAAFAYDSATNRAPNGLTASSANAPLVNWDVVRVNWNGIKADLHDDAVYVERGWKRLAFNAASAGGIHGFDRAGEVAPP